MIDLNHSQNLAVSRRVSCFRDPFLSPALVAALGRQSWLLFGWLLLATPVAVQAQFNYVGTDGMVTITGYTGTNRVVVIPDTITGLPVTAIGGDAFNGNWRLTSVTIPNSVTSIGGGAFAGTGLINLTIPNSVTNIGSYYFRYNNPADSGTWVGAFSFCAALTSVIISNNVIGDFEFSSCGSLTNVTLGSGVTSIGSDAFSRTDEAGNYYGCPLSNITIPNSVTCIGYLAFAGCRQLTDVTLGSGVTNIGGGAFSGCSSLTNILLSIA